MSNQDTIAKYRNRIIEARLASMKKKTGSHCILINLPDGRMSTVELSESKLNDWLKYFELVVYDGKKRTIAELEIIDHYQTCVSKHCDKLSEFGNNFVNGLIKEMSASTSNGDSATIEGKPCN